MDSTDPLPSSGVPRPEPRASTIGHIDARTLRVKVSEFGLPLEVQIEPDMLAGGASAVAREILNLCELGAARCGAARREELAETGIPDYILDKLGLATPAQVADLELRQSDEQMERRS